MKKFFSILLILTFFINISTNVLAKENLSKLADNDMELQRTIEYGLLTDTLLSHLEEPITFQEMCTMLKDEIERYFGKEKANEFSDAAGPGMTMDEPMTRDAGMLALFYAADIMGYCANYGEGFSLNEEIGEKVWNELQPNYHGAFPNFEQPIASPIDCIKPDEGWGNHAVAAYFYMLTVRSMLTGNLLLDYDDHAQSFHLGQPLTCKDAVKSVLRLMETNPPSVWEVPPINNPSGTGHSAESLPEELDLNLQENLQERIGKILNTESEITKSEEFVPGKTYTGTAYYISPNGSDENDGLSPETPWQTLDKVIEQSNPYSQNGCLEYGDAVFFERGGTWRLTDDPDPELYLGISVPGITYSAYGEGPKPVVTASPESGTGPEKWELYYSDSSGKKIWKYYKDLMDIGAIYFNNGEISTKRIYEIWSGNGYVSAKATDDPSDTSGLAGTLIEKQPSLISVEDSLTENLTIISRPRSKTPVASQNPLEFHNEIPGPLYLRCDQGNPGELYDSIEFAALNHHGVICVAANDIVLDNLAIKYAGSSFASCTDTNVTGTVIQNCEFAYGAGTVSSYREDSGFGDYISIQFNGLSNFLDVSIENNYIHDINGIAVGYSHSSDTAGKTFPFSFYLNGNAIVNTAGIRLDSTSEYLQQAEKVYLLDNMIFETGFWDTEYYKSEGALQIWPNSYKEFLIKGNVFYGTKGNSDYWGIIHETNGENEIFNSPSMVLENNIYIQDTGKTLITFSQNRQMWAAETVSSQQFREEMGTDTDQVYVKD